MGSIPFEFFLTLPHIDFGPGKDKLPDVVSLRSPSVRSGPAQVPYLKGPDGTNRKTERSLSEHKVRTNIANATIRGGIND